MRDELVMAVPREVLFAGRDAFQGFVPEAGPYLTTAMREYLFIPRRRAERDERYKQIIPYVVVRVAQEGGGEPLYLMFQRASGGDPRLLRQYSLGIGGHVNTGDVLAAPLVRRRSGTSGGGGLGGRGGPGPGGSARRWAWPLPVTPQGPDFGSAGRGRRPPSPGSLGPEPPVWEIPGAARVVRRIRLAPALRDLLEPRMRTRVHEHPLFRGLRRELLEELTFPRGAGLAALGAINDDSDSVGRVHFGLVFVLSVPPRKRAPSSGWPAGMRVRRKPSARRWTGRIKARVRIRPEPGGSVQIGSLFALEQVRAYAGAMEGWSVLILRSGLLPGGVEGRGADGRK